MGEMAVRVAGEGGTEMEGQRTRQTKGEKENFSRRNPHNRPTGSHK